MAEQSRTVIEALDAIRDAIVSSRGKGEIRFQQVANGPVEAVFAYGTQKVNVLKNPPPAKGTHFAGTGFLTDLHGNVLEGSKVETSYPLSVPPDKVQDFLAFLYSWPPPQEEPFTDSPVDAANTNPPGPAREHHDFGDGNSLTIVGYSLPKVVKLQDGGAQYSVTNTSAITQGSGIYEGARGLACYVGSAYFPVWPEKPPDLFKLLAKGFTVKASVAVRLVLKGPQAPPPPPPAKAAPAAAKEAPAAAKPAPPAAKPARPAAKRAR